jgi:hypothetical protein
VFGSYEIMTVECFVFLRPLGFGVFVSPGLNPVVVVVPRQKTKSGFGWKRLSGVFFLAEF